MTDEGFPGVGNRPGALPFLHLTILEGALTFAVLVFAKGEIR
jgi:hypothetical protein